MVDVSGNVVLLFDELIARGEQIKETCKKLYFSGGKKPIDVQAYEAWRTSCLTLLRSTFGTSSPHYDSFTGLKFFDHYNSTLLYLGILQSARDDIRKGYFYHKDLMLSVNVFTALLRHADAMASRGAHVQAAGVLESVLHEALRKLSDAQGLATADASAADMAACADALCGAGALSAEARERIRTFAEFLRACTAGPSTAQSVAAWVEWVRGFVYEQLGTRIVIVN
jgi:hypothetical protein